MMQLPATIGKYQLLKFLGGGMSHVYMAHDTMIDRPVVVKILTDQASSDAEAKARFLQEARLAGQIQHENIVSVFDYGEHDGHPFIVMEYLKGEDLRDAIRGGRLGSLSNRLKISLDIAGALGYVHGRAIVHRDIKPENIHIDPSGRVKLMDFGIAKTADLSLTKTGMAMGTPYYMSPEQVSGRANTSLVDVYAYGLLVYELITGVRAVNGEMMEQVFYQILHENPDVAAMENAGAPPELRQLVLACTAKKPEDRPQSFDAIIQQLRAIMSADTGFKTQPVAVHPKTGPALGATVVTPQATPQMLKQASAPPAGGSKTMVWVALALVIVAVAGVAIWKWPHATPPIQEAPPPPEIAGMTLVPGGSFLHGEKKDQATLPAFYIDLTEVSNADYCKAMDCIAKAGEEDLPVVNVTVVQARDYAAKVGKRLPKDLEWERAMRGTEGSLFPWGDQIDSSKANVFVRAVPTHHLMPVRSFAAYPEYNMIGNAFEIVDGHVTPTEAEVNRMALRVSPPPTAQEAWVAIRGGSYLLDVGKDVNLVPDLAWDSSKIPERYSNKDIGFRCAKTP